MDINATMKKPSKNWEKNSILLEKESGRLRELISENFVPRLELKCCAIICDEGVLG